jgi:hypothetical protein
VARLEVPLDSGAASRHFSGHTLAKLASTAPEIVYKLKVMIPAATR